MKKERFPFAVICCTLVLLLSACIAEKPAETTTPIVTVKPTETTLPTTTPTTQPTEFPTTAPTTQPTEAPTTAPTTAPTEAPTTAPTTQPTVPTTAPTEPILSPELWAIEPEYLSYDAYFSEDREYVITNSWLISTESGSIAYSIPGYGRDLYVASSTHEERYMIPNQEQFAKHRYMGTDGKYAYLSNENELLKVELLTGNLVSKIEADSILNWYVTIYDGRVGYYTNNTGEELQIIRVYLPEMRQDILLTLKEPLCMFSLGHAENNLGDLTWSTFNPEFLTVLKAELENPNSKYKSTEQLNFSDIWAMEDPLNMAHRDPMELLSYEIQKDTNIPAFIEYSYNQKNGTTTSRTFIVDGCYFGTGTPDDHFNPIHVDLGTPTVITDSWKSLPGMVIQAPLPDTKLEQNSYFVYTPFLSTPTKLYLRVDGIYTEILDAQLKCYPDTVDTGSGICCITQDNKVLQLSYDGSVCNTLYVSSGNIIDYAYQDGFLYVVEDDKILEIDLENYQYRTVVQHTYLSSISAEGKDKLYFLVSEGLSSEAYTYNIKDAVIEPYSGMWH